MGRCFFCCCKCNGGGGGGGGVITPCCPGVTLPSTLCLNWAGVIYNLVYNSGTIKWEFLGDVCGIANTLITFDCYDNPSWELNISGGLITSTNVPNSCNPFNWDSSTPLLAYGSCPSAIATVTPCSSMAASLVKYQNNTLVLNKQAIRAAVMKRIKFRSSNI